MSEFSHYTGCRGRDPDNCSGCALTQGGPEGPNYAGWPLAYAQAGRTIPRKWEGALLIELLNARERNPGYFQNLISKLSGESHD